MEHEKNVRYFKRYQALYLFLSGMKRAEVAKIVGITTTSVTRIHQLFRKNGLSAIPDKPREGRPPKLTSEQKEQI